MTFSFSGNSIASNSSSSPKVHNGIDVLETQKFKSLNGLRVGLITNQSGINSKKKSTIDLLFEAPKVRLTKLFSPEHGIRGDQDVQEIDNEVDPKTGLQIISLMRNDKGPKQSELKNIDVLVFDIQDIGTRFFTYISTMKLSMIAAAKAKIKFIVLDRINPIGGETVEGPFEIDREVFVGIHPIPVRHGMTIGELAQLFNKELKLNLDLEVVKVSGLKRNMSFKDMGLEWLNPSPIMNGPTTALLYPGVGLVEFAVSVGRGTDFPFEKMGAPYVNEHKFAAELNKLNLPGIEIKPDRFTPMKSVFEGQACGGVKLRITNAKEFRPVSLGLALAHTLNKMYPGKFSLKKLNILLLNKETIKDLQDGDSFLSILKRWKQQSSDFEKRRQEYLIYN